MNKFSIVVNFLVFLIVFLAFLIAFGALFATLIQDTNIRILVGLILGVLAALGKLFEMYINEQTTNTFHNTLLELLQRDQIQREKRRIKPSLQTAMNSARDIPLKVNPEAKARSCLFVFKRSRPNSDGPCLAIELYSGTFSEQELHLCFKKGEGAVGQVWANPQEPIIAYLNEISKEGLSSVWGLRPEQIQCTTHLQSIVAMPIIASNRLAGVLSVDSKQPMSVCVLNNQEVMEELREVAIMIGLFLETVI